MTRHTGVLPGPEQLEPTPAEIAKVRASAEQGDASAQNRLGIMYADGLGVPQDDAEAARLYRLAAEQGNAIAQSNLGVITLTGRGVPQDDAEAIRWYRLAAEQGYAAGQRNLGVAYTTGRGVRQDNVAAYTWFSLAASAASGNFLDDYVNSRDRAAERLNPDQLAEAQRLAREWDAPHPREP